MTIFSSVLINTSVMHTFTHYAFRTFLVMCSLSSSWSFRISLILHAYVPPVRAFRDIPARETRCSSNVSTTNSIPGPRCLQIVVSKKSYFGDLVQMLIKIVLEFIQADCYPYLLRKLSRSSSIDSLRPLMLLRLRR